VKTLTIKRQLVASTKLTTPGKNPGNLLAMHETANTSPTATAQAHANLQTRGNDRNVSWHWQVDEREAIQSFRHDQKCWHAGDGVKGRGLNESIAIEVCVNGNVKKAWDNAAKLAAHLLLNADDVAASTTGDIEQHFNFSGKNCPRLLRAGSHGITWTKFIANVQKYMKQKEEPNMAGMTSPAQGRVSSEYGRRAPIPGVSTGTFHAGIDIANKVGTPVYAAFAGTVISTGTNGVPGRSGKYILIANPDGERQYYGHLNKIRVKAGQKVKQGQRIGDMGATGNVTGPHLHFEIWRNASHTSHRNPRIDFNHFGIAPGSKPRATSSAPKPKPAPKPAKGKSSAAVLKRQRDLNRYAKAGLVEDGIRGPVMKAWDKWVRQAQGHLNKFKSSRKKLIKDGHYGPVMAAYVRDVQSRNGLHVDGMLGPVMIRWMRSHGSKIKNRPSNRP